MKILTIRLKNLNSLKGESFINFEDSPLRDSGLFLITGNTGSGKSTILDAITLALFGLVPRFVDMSINKKETQIMTHGATNCYAEVEFKNLGKIYRAKWSLRKTRTGNFSDSVRELAELSADRKNSRILATKKKEVEKLVEDLLGGLNFKRFTRSVLLAQGEFAQFLKGTKDRSTILERITNSDRFSKISTAAFDRHKEAQLELDKLQEQSANVHLLSLEDKELLEEKLKADYALHSSQEKVFNTQQEQLQIIAKLEQLLKDKKQLQEQLDKFIAQQKEAQTSFDQLDLHQKAIQFKPALNELEQLNKNLLTVTEEINQLIAAAVLAKAQLKELIKQKKGLDEDLQKAKKVYATFEVVYDKVVKLDTQIESEKKITLSLSKEIETLARTSSNKAKAIQIALEEKKTLIKEQKETDAWLTKNKVYASLMGSETIFELKNQYKDLQKYQLELKAVNHKQNDSLKKISTLEKQEIDLEKQAKLNSSNLKKQHNAYHKLCKEFKLDTNRSHDKHLEYLQEQQNQKDLLLQELKKVEQERKKHQEILDDIIKIDTDIENKEIEMSSYDQEFLLEEENRINIQKLEAYYEMVYNEQQAKNNLSAFRGKLIKDKECPLCFSKEQPFRTMNVDIDLSLKIADQDLQNAKIKRKKIDAKYLEIIGNQRALDHSIKDLQKSKNAILIDLLSIEETIRLIMENKNLNITPLIHKKIALQDKIEGTASLIKQYLDLEKKLIGIHQEIEISQKDEEIINNKVLRNALDLKEATHQQGEQKTEQQYYSKKIETTKENIEDQLAIYKLQEGLPEAIEVLEQFKDDYATQHKLQQTQASKLTQVELQISNATDQAKEAKSNEKLKKKSWEKQKNELDKIYNKRFDLFGEDSVQIAKKQKLEQLDALDLALEENTKLSLNLEHQQATSTGIESEKTKQKKHFQKSIDKKQPKLLKAINKIGIASLVLLKTSILDQKEAESIAKHRQGLQKYIHSTQEKLQSNSEQQATTQKKLTTPVQEIEALQTANQELQEQLNELQQTIGGTKEKLQHQETQEKINKGLMKEIRKHKKEVGRWAILKEVIGSSDGKKFRVFAQSITLKKLIYLANQHLKYFINGRYKLEKRYQVFKDTRLTDLLEIDIVDTFQANNKRPLNTLSGGESFLASLALALGLSDLAGGKAKIESLFIDEGFGTLDADTLQVAIRALQTLQSTGKTIGVISHIEQLKQSIPTQIHVVKKGGGFSNLTVLEV